MYVSSSTFNVSGGGGMQVPACHPEKGRNISSCFMVMIAEMSLSLTVLNTDFTIYKFVCAAVSMLVCWLSIN